MTTEERGNLIGDTVTRVINSAPVSEILRVYSLALQNELDKLSDNEIRDALLNAGYIDIVEKYFDSEGIEDEGISEESA